MHDDNDYIPPLVPIGGSDSAEPDDEFEYNSEDDRNMPSSSTSAPTTRRDFYNRNPAGRNQHGEPSLKATDPVLENALRELHREGITKYEEYSRRLHSDYNIIMKPKTVQRRLATLELFASSKTAKIVPEQVRLQLLAEELETDPNNTRAPPNIIEGVLRKSNVSLGRDWTRDQMHALRPEGFEKREPTAKKIHRGQLVALGPHDTWSADGHDKMSKIGFPVYGIRDVWSGYFLGLWLLPNNRVSKAVGYVFLKLVYERGGFPNQTTTDCGSETTFVFGLGQALREMFAPEIPKDDVRAHQYLRSVHNITIERAWLRLWLNYGDNFVTEYNKGIDDGTYDEEDEKHVLVAKWVWSTIAKANLEYERTKFNAHVPKKDPSKLLPSGVRPSTLIASPERYGGLNQLHEVDREVIKAVMEEMGGEDNLKFVEDHVAEACEVVYEVLGKPVMDTQTGWDVFRAMLPHVEL